ncbi:MAG: hypothetical protein SGILL_000427 [Bacillariaceae sp.]
MQREENHDGAMILRTEAFRDDLLGLARDCETDDDYRDFERRLLEPPLQFAPDDDDYAADVAWHVRYMSEPLLHAVLGSSGQVPLGLVEKIIALGGVELASQVDFQQNRPLHILAESMPHRSDVATFLLEKSPEAVGHLNLGFNRPIDIISSRIIMADEAMKYGKDVDLDGMWETVHCIAEASRRDIELQQPLLHSCVVSPSFPVALLQRAIIRYPKQVNEVNDDGNLPLHLWASKPRLERDAGQEENGVETSLLTLVLKTNICAATTLNNDGKSPLALAILNGHGWNSSVVLSIMSHAPASLETLELPLSVLPFLYQRLVQDERWYPVFSLLRATPPEVSHSVDV